MQQLVTQIQEPARTSWKGKIRLLIVGIFEQKNIKLILDKSGDWHTISAVVNENGGERTLFDAKTLSMLYAKLEAFNRGLTLYDDLIKPKLTTPATKTIEYNGKQVESIELIPDFDGLMRNFLDDCDLQARVLEQMPKEYHEQAHGIISTFNVALQASLNTEHGIHEVARRFFALSERSRELYQAKTIEGDDDYDTTESMQTN